MSQITRKTQVVISTPEDHFLLLQTNLERGSYWQNCTGKIEENEDFLEGALREAMEETGLLQDNVLQVRDINLQHEFNDRWNRQVVERAILIQVKGKWEIIIDPSEHQAYKWITSEELKLDAVKYPGNFEALKKARELLRSQS